ncbi:hypothetical protein MSAN_00115700 [Mycena sanguinolenta]|uniref:G-protein coupled receptors family 2 profile 2 domain-containing protein n=1 Tax=Mycena sanguinolenta TaxID=230812 RepID=A0A8H7DLQ9_9AGAR|nr:hypothetical protein MSAN_00115700 [Mycena sanguinolenta]
MAFEFTSHMTVVSNNLWAVTSAVGAGLCFLVLVIIAAVWSYPRSRAHLDRVSFRVVIYVVFANMLFGTASAVGGTRTGPGFLCGFSIFILQLTLQFSGFMLFSIALNLQLVVVHGKNGQRLEKYYLIGSTLLAFALVIPPYAAHQYGWDPLEEDCWYTNDNRSQRIAWQVGTQTAWTFLTVIGELICSTRVLIFLFRHDLRLRKVFTLATGSMSHASRVSSTAPQVIKATRYKSVILRVALYPAFSCVVNLLSIATVLHSTISNGIHNTTDYNVLLLSDFLYGGRAIVYGLLAASDPALIRGVTTLVRAILGYPEPTTSVMDPTSIASSNDNRLIVHVELSSFQSPPPLEERNPDFKLIQNEHTLKQDYSGHGVPAALDNYDLRPSRDPEALANSEQNVTFNSPSTAFEGRTRRRAEKRMIEEDSFEKGL